MVVAIVASGAFAGAAVYVSAVEHPARVKCGTEVALRQFAPSYKRATVMQASLAIVGLIAGLIVSWQNGDRWVALAAVLLGAIVPYTLIVILPTNARLLDPALAGSEAEALLLLRRWGRLHAVRTVASCAAFLILLLRAVGVL